MPHRSPNPSTITASSTELPSFTTRDDEVQRNSFQIATVNASATETRLQQRIELIESLFDDFPSDFVDEAIPRTAEFFRADDPNSSITLFEVDFSKLSQIAGDDNVNSRANINDIMNLSSFLNEYKGKGYILFNKYTGSSNNYNSMEMFLISPSGEVVECIRFNSKVNSEGVQGLESNNNNSTVATATIQSRYETTTTTINTADITYSPDASNQEIALDIYVAYLLGTTSESSNTTEGNYAEMEERVDQILGR
jgi:hypothetical protein